MSPREHWSATFNRYAWVAIACALCGGVAGFVSSGASAPVYSARATLWVEGIVQRDYAGEMRARLQAPIRGRLTITQAPGSRFVSLRYDDTSAVAAAQVLNGLARRYIATSPNWPSRLVILDSAAAPTASASAGRYAATIRWTLVALVAGLAIAVIMTSRERRRTSD